jgi:hypothetical protein
LGEKKLFCIFQNLVVSGDKHCLMEAGSEVTAKKKVVSAIGISRCHQGTHQGQVKLSIYSQILIPLGTLKGRYDKPMVSFFVETKFLTISPLSSQTSTIYTQVMSKIRQSRIHHCIC